jgi:hypothetical protein
MDPTIIQIKQLIAQVELLREELDIADDIIQNLFEDDNVLLEYALNEKKNWIQGAIKKPGALHKSLKVKEGKNIPMGKLEKAAEKGGKLGKRARLALTLKKLRAKKK